MRKTKLIIFVILVLFFVRNMLLAQTTGKISGKIVDAETSQPLPGANIIIEGTYSGAAADVNGDFYIINLNPGVYTLKVQVIGYKPVIVKDVRVSVNRTAYMDINMEQTVLMGQAVIVEAKKIAVRKDQTSTIKNISSDKIEMLPIENISDIVSMQAGVVEGHFRGGRLTEVSYLVDGHKIVVVGEVPLATAELIAHSVELVVH